METDRNNLLDAVQAIERFPKSEKKGYRPGLVVRLQPGTDDAVIDTIMARLAAVETEDILLNKDEKEPSIAIYIRGEQTKVMRQVWQILAEIKPESDSVKMVASLSARLRSLQSGEKLEVRDSDLDQARGNWLKTWKDTRELIKKLADVAREIIGTGKTGKGAVELFQTEAERLIDCTLDDNDNRALPYDMRSAISFITENLAKGNKAVLGGYVRRTSSLPDRLSSKVDNDTMSWQLKRDIGVAQIAALCDKFGRVNLSARNQKAILQLMLLKSEEGVMFDEEVARILGITDRAQKEELKMLWEEYGKVRNSIEESYRPIRTG